ncbi:MAG: hypothetical protein P8J63_04465 [Verrucomicrobiota bacterium]|nr:hypothetical protein [Verrucomicrobiota bacterium]
MKHQRNALGGFSIAEVMLAIGVVAFGLVAVLGVLPAGLTVQKDNREETIIRYDAQYWMTALRAGMQPTDALHQVEWVELQVDDGAGPVVYRAHRPRLGGDGAGPEWRDLPSLFRGHLKQASWPTDVIGWMSIPDNGTALGSVKKTARVRAMNGQLFDRIYGRKVLVATRQEFVSEGSTAFHPLPGGEFAFSYLLETHIAPDPANVNLWRITLTFKWPVLDDPTLKGSTKNAADVKTVSTKSFTTLVGAPPRETLARQQLPLNQKLLLDVTLPGEKITIEELSALTGMGMITVNNTLLSMEQSDLAADIPEPEAERASPGQVRPDDKWRMGRTYDTHGLYSLRPMTGAPSNGGYRPVFGRFRAEQDRFLGFTEPTNSFFSSFYFFTPDYQ